MISTKYFKFVVGLCILVTLLMNSAASTPASAACGGWSVVSSPNGGPDNQLYGVAAVSASNVWAVGGYQNSNGNDQTLIEHWNGKQWQIVSSPNVGINYNILYGVAAVSASNVWAVGYSVGSNGNDQVLIEHWNGKQWQIVSSPNVGIGSSLNMVAAVSATSIWAVGDFINANGNEQTLIEQWNGTHWIVVSSPSPGSSGNELRGVSADSSNDVWAVGDYSNSNSPENTLIEQWNGSQWSIIKSPDVAQYSNSLLSVTALSATNVWAVGYSEAELTANTLVEHWNGSQWSVVPGPNPGSAFDFLYGVRAVSATNIWAVGTYANNRYGPYHTLTERWNGNRWEVFSSPGPGATINKLTAVVAVSATNLWTVGFDSNALGGPHRTLTEHDC